MIVITDILMKKIKDNNALYDKQTSRVIALEELCRLKYLEWIDVEQRLSDAYQELTRLDDMVAKEVIHFDRMMEKNNG